MSRLECARCGLTPFELPDDVDPEMVFEAGPDGRVYDQGCLTLVAAGRDLEVP